MQVNFIEIKYHCKDLIKLEKISIGDWIDLRAAENVIMKSGEFQLISLGVSMRLPNGYEANIVPRSSTAKKFGIIQANHFGVVDNSYSGTNDLWYFPAVAIGSVDIKLNDRICQFRLNKVQDTVEFIEVDKLDEKDRGGFGSTGIAWYLYIDVLKRRLY